MSSGEEYEVGTCASSSLGSRSHKHLRNDAESILRAQVKRGARGKKTWVSRVLVVSSHLSTDILIDVLGEGEYVMTNRKECHQRFTIQWKNYAISDNT